MATFVMVVKKYFIVFLLAFTLVGCISQPRYTSHPVERKKPSPLEEKEENKKETSSLEEQGETKIDQAKMSQIIKSFLGTPYKKGGASKNGMDCSGFVIAVYKEYGKLELAHNTDELFKLAKKADKKDLRYGDLVFFSDYWFSPSHVGIYIGEGRFVHSTKRIRSPHILL